MALALHDADLHLWLVRPERALDPALVAAYRALLAADEQERHRRFVHEARRHEYLVTRALVRTALSRYAPLAPEAWRFAPGPHGRPEIAPPCGLRFNLSNATGLVACAVSRREVGVDLEHTGRGELLLELAETVFSAAERRGLDALPPPLRADRAVSLWTLKEAYVKARGAGLSLPLDAITFTVEPGGIAAAFGPALGDDPARWTFRLLDHAGHRIAIATEGPARLRAREIVPGAPAPELPVVDDP